jgi:N6-adenosine-specific RNA methylase IME4
MTYRTIVADPPWHIGSNTRSGGGRGGPMGLPYATMSIQEVAALPVADLAAKSAHLYLWTVTSVIRDTFSVVEAWGFKPKQILVWCKPGLGSGMRFRQNVEYVIFGTRGAGLPITRRDVGTWHQWPRGEHSAKPEAFLDLVEQVSPGPYLEMFARRARFGWDYWGDQSLGTAAMTGSRLPEPSEGEDPRCATCRDVGAAYCDDCSSRVRPDARSGSRLPKPEDH